MGFFENLKQKAKTDPKIVVLPELGSDKDSVIKEAIEIAQEEETAIPIGLTSEAIEDSGKFNEFVNAYAKLRDLNKGGAERTIKRLNKGAFFAAMMVRLGYAHAMVAGKYITSADVMMPVNAIIGEQESKIKSAIFFREPQQEYKCFNLAACADVVVNQNPDPEQLYKIIVTSAETFEILTGKEPRIALMSYITGEPQRAQLSRDPELKKILDALTLYKESGHKWPICQAQGDAFLNPDIAKKKNALFKDRPADLWIGSNLIVSNVVYKLLQELIEGGNSMIVTQGLNYPAMDLSRGDNSSNIANVISTCSVIAQSFEKQSRYKTIDKYFLNL